MEISIYFYTKQRFIRSNDMNKEQDNNLKPGFKIVHIDKESLKSNFLFVNSVSIFKCVSGSAVVKRDESEWNFCNGAHFVISEISQMVITEYSDDFRCIKCQVDLDFASELYPYLDSKIWNILEYSNPESCRVGELDMLDAIFGQLCIIYEIDNFMYKRQMAIHTLLNYIYVLCNVLLQNVDVTKIQQESISTLNNSVLDKFYTLCSQYHTKERNIEFYAEKLHISKRHLYNITFSSMKQTPKQLLDSFVVGTIKKLLLTSSLSVQQISDTLNFPDQSTLRQFFKRSAGVSPTKYRKSNKQ